MRSFPCPGATAPGEYSNIGRTVSPRRSNTITLLLPALSPVRRKPGTHALYRFLARREHLVEGVPYMKHVGCNFEFHFHTGFAGTRGKVARIIEQHFIVADLNEKRREAGEVSEIG